MIWKFLLITLFLATVGHSVPLEENDNTRSFTKAGADVENYRYNYYMTFEQIKKKLLMLQEAHPDKMKMEVVGSSREGNDLYLVIITKFPHKRNPVFFVDSGIHAREWVTPAAGLYLIEQLLKTPSMISRLEWRIMPMVNPDGYIYSHKSKSKRFWRKNRANIPGSRCVGVDLNRNTDVYWERTNQNPCREDYSGSRAFSEPESRAVKRSLLDVKDRLEAYVTLHTYGQVFLYPYGYTMDIQPPNVQKFIDMGNGMSDAIYRRYHNRYKVLQAAAIGAAAGGTDDWALMKGGATYSFTFELQPAVGSNLHFRKNGFELSAWKLLQAVDECWIALHYMAEKILHDGAQKRLETSKIDEDSPSDLDLKYENMMSMINRVRVVAATKKRETKVTGNKKDCTIIESVYVCPHMIFWNNVQITN